MEVKNHKLFVDGEQVPFKQTPNVSAGTINVKGIIIHYTAGGTGEGAVRVLTNRKRKASAHLVVDRDGRIWQLTNFNTKAWHAGASAYNGKKYHNNFTVGIEIDNPGYLFKIDDKFYTWWDKKTKRNPIPENDVVVAKHRNYPKTKTQYWHKYTDLQVKKVFEICDALCKSYDIQEILGHEEIMPYQKTDPGPAFPLDELREKVLHNGQIFQPDTFGKTTDKLNIRERPNQDADQVAAALTKDYMLELLKEVGNWMKVKAKLVGWVSKGYVEHDNTDSHTSGVVSASSLNIRSGPDGDYHKIAKALPEGTEVKILEQNNGWYKISTKVTGWVLKEFVSVV